MVANPLRLAIRQGLQDDSWLKGEFGRALGGSKHPRGGVLSAYRRARAAMDKALKGGATSPAEVMSGLQSELFGITFQSINSAAAQGLKSGNKQVTGYRADGATIIQTGEAVNNSAFVNSWMSTYATQEAQVNALLASGGDPGLIVGDSSRQGVLTPGPMLQAGTQWIATALATQVLSSFGTPTGPRWGKQALPNIDNVTTDCCLRVAGQVRPIDGKFRTTGEPHFARLQDWSPFHWNCRTSVVLYRSNYDDGVTQEIRGQVRGERKKRREAEDEETRTAGG